MIDGSYTFGFLYHHNVIEIMFHSSSGMLRRTTNIENKKKPINENVFLVLVIDTHYIRWDEISRYVTIDHLRFYLRKKYFLSPLCLLEINEDNPISLRGKYRKLVDYIDDKEGITIYITSNRSKAFMKNVLADQTDK